MLVDLFGPAHLKEASLVHDPDPIGHGQSLFLVVSDVDEGDADPALQVLELDLHRLSQLEIEGSERLVEEQDFRLVDQRPGQCHPLLHATGELTRSSVGPFGELDLVEHPTHPSLDF